MVDEWNCDSPTVAVTWYQPSGTSAVHEAGESTACQKPLKTYRVVA